jgi:hypothetical protein
MAFSRTTEGGRSEELTLADLPRTISSASEALPLVQFAQHLLAAGALEPTEPVTKLLRAFENWCATAGTHSPGELDLLASPVVVSYPWAYAALASSSASLPTPAASTPPVPAPWAQLRAVVDI